MAGMYLICCAVFVILAFFVILAKVFSSTKKDVPSSNPIKSTKYFQDLRQYQAKSKTLSFTDAKPKLQEVLDFLEHCHNYTTDEVGDALHDLVTFPEDISPELTQEGLARNRKDIGNYLTEHGYSELFLHIVSSLKNNLRVHSKARVTQALENLRLTFRGFCNYTAWCTQLQVDFVAHGGVAVLLPLLEYIDRNLAQCEPDSEAVPLIQQILLFLIPIFQNCIKYCPQNRKTYRDADVFSVLSNIRSKDRNVRLLSLLTLAYIVDDKQSQSLAKSHDCIKLLTDMLRECVDSSDHAVVIEPLCYSVREILDGLNKLTINDENKVELKKHGGVRIISQIVEDDSFSEEEKRLAVESLGALVFVKSIRDTKEVHETKPMLKKLATSENAHLRSASKFCLWEINELDGNNVASEVPLLSSTRNTDVTGAKEAKSSLSGHVMISYQWDSQKYAIYVRDKLREMGYNVWLDLDEMKGDILDAMATAVEKSSVVLICMSEKYKDSYNCRSEANYAYKLKRPMIPLLMEEGYNPDGWLGIILGTKLYYKFCCDRDTDIDGLLKGIRELVEN